VAVRPDLLAAIQSQASELLAEAGERRVVVWGAGELGCWLMGELGDAGVGFVDTNPAKVGTRIAERWVWSPEKLEELIFDEVWISVLSDSAGIEERLAERGIPHRLAFPGGKRLQVQDQLPRTLDFLGGLDLAQREVLEVGSGGQLFLALTLAHLGARRVVISDVGPLGNALETRRDQWRAFLEHLERVHPTGAEAAELLARIELESEGVDAARLPYPDGHFDIVANTGVLEHVDDPARAIAEFARVLRPGGLALCLAVGIHDHRANDPSSGFTPWSFLEVGGAEWRALGSGPYHQNRWRAVDFLRAFEGTGFEPLRTRTTRDPRLREEHRPRFAPEFRAGAYTLEELAELDLHLVARRGSCAATESWRQCS